MPRYVLDVSGELIARGHSVDAVVCSGADALSDDLRALGVGVAEVPFRPEMVAPFADLRSAGSLARLLAPRRWDVVHTHGNKGGLLGRPLARMLGMPVVHSPHGFAYLSQRHRPRRGIELRRALTLGIERALAPWTSVIVCASADDRDNALRDGIAPPDRLVIVHNAADPPEADADPQLAALPGEGPLVGFLARLADQKDPLAFVEAVGALRRRGVQFRAAMVGDGPLERDVRERVARDGLEDVIAVRPFDGSAAPALAAFDVYVLPSRWEVFGITLLEAMAASLPIVATRVGGIPEVVVDEQTGLLVPRDDGVALVEAIERLIGDPELRTRLGRAGRARWESRFRVAAMVDGVEAAYERALR